jgi:hypothetical protein
MRIKALLVLTALAAAATPAAFAQGRSCAEVRQNNQVGGAIVGSILGGVLGSNVAGRGHKSDGTALGAVVGGMIGAGAGGNVRCAQPPQGYNNYGYGAGSDYNQNPNYGGRYYDPAPSGYGYSPGYSSGRYGSEPYYADNLPHDGYRPDLARDDRRNYKRNDDFAGSECRDSIQVTRLPDGSEIRRPVEVCRDSYYGEWQVVD